MEEYTSIVFIVFEDMCISTPIAPSGGSVSEAYAHTKQFIIPMHFTFYRKKKKKSNRLLKMLSYRDIKRAHAQK